MSSSHPTYHRCKGLVWRWFRGTVLIGGKAAGLADHQQRTLEGSAAVVWGLLEEPMSEADLAAAVTESGVAEESTVDDLAALVHEAVQVLTEAEMIEQM